jgi:hypothetical protein
MKHKDVFVALAWVQTLFSVLGGGSLTVGTWLVSSAYVTSRLPFTWVFGAMLFVLSVATVLTAIVVVSVNPGLRRVYIFVGVMCSAACGWSVVIMYRHPLVATTTPCPAGTYGAPDMTNCLPCRCVHGTCSDGRNGDGACDCDVRWRGRYCDRCDQNVLHNMANPDGPALCDFCIPGWAMPACQTCYPGYTGSHCDTCTDTVQRYELVTVPEYAEGVDGWGEHPEWGLNPWGERRDNMIPLYGTETVNNIEMLRCDGCRRKDDQPTGAVVRNTRFCTEVDCNTMDEGATITENAMPDSMRFTNTECFDDYDCPTWFCYKNRKTPAGVCAAFSRERMGCTCSAFGAVGALCLFCDAVSEVRQCGKGNCIWNVFDQPWLKPHQAVDSTYGQVECMCRDGSEVGGERWTRYPKDLTDRRELDGTLNLKNASCTVRTDVRGCADNTFGKHCLPCKCSGHGLCAETVDGDGSCKCTLDNTFSVAASGMWGGTLCDRCLNDCELNSDTCVVQFETGYGGSNNDFGRCNGALAAVNRSKLWEDRWGYIFS